MDPTVAALAGAFIVAAASVATSYFQTRSDNNRHAREFASKLAVEEFKIAYDHFHKSGGELIPLVVFLAYNQELVLLLEKGSITSDGLEKIAKLRKNLIDTVKKSED